MQEGSRKGLGRVQEGGFLCRKGGASCARRGGGVPMQEGGSWGVPGTVPVQEREGFLSDVHMPQPTHGAQLKPSNSPPLALPLPLTLGTQY